MTEKRYLLKYSEFETSNGEIIEADPYFIDTQEEYIDDDDFTIDGYLTMSGKQILDLLNKNEQLKQQINDIRLDWNQDCREFNKDTLYIEDHNTKIKLKDGILYIEVFIPKINNYFRFNYIVTGRRLEKEYNTIKGDSDD